MHVMMLQMSLEFYVAPFINSFVNYHLSIHTIAASNTVRFLANLFTAIRFICRSYIFLLFRTGT